MSARVSAAGAMTRTCPSETRQPEAGRAPGFFPGFGSGLRAKLSGVQESRDIAPAPTACDASDPPRMEAEIARNLGEMAGGRERSLAARPACVQGYACHNGLSLAAAPPREGTRGT